MSIDPVSGGRCESFDGCSFILFHSAAAWRSKRGPVKPPKKEDLVDLGRTFGVAFGGSDDSDSSDAEFAPEDEDIDSDGLL